MDVESIRDQRAHEGRWTLLIPVKRLEIAKSRLALDAVDRIEVALAMAVDTVSAALKASTVAEVVVVTDDARATRELGDLGARMVADVPDAGLNPALLHGATLATRASVAALSSDLPGLLADELDAVLRAADAHPRAVVGDATGSGTTLLAARTVAGFTPAFGVGSRSAHVDAGAVDLTEQAGWSVRHDVDTVEALLAAARRGVGPRTHAVLAELGLDDPGTRERQGTIAAFDPDSRGGVVWEDDGTAIAFEAAAFDASGLRLLRIGQRVRLRADETGVVTFVSILTL
ncbi:MAG TPA: 2-phospho-L-lactate guanylyltransferase [Mycobacteriales bacterium]|nr:2-phospho-L-lactate guanylyltransferase [Mycobacteriales bacterium]